MADKEKLLVETLDSCRKSIRYNSLTKRRFNRSISAPEGVYNRDQDHTNLSPRNQTCSMSANTLKFRVVIIILLAYVGVGAFSFYLVQDEIKGQKTNGIIDSIYLCVVTMTTVGYGDLVPKSTTSKILACVFVLMGMGLVAFFLSQAADKVVETQEIYLVKAMHLHDHRNPVDMIREVEGDRLKYKLYVVLLMLIIVAVVGTIFLHMKEGYDLFDSLYCVCATMTTLGYGDYSFSTPEGRVFAAFWIVISTICMAQFFCTLVELHTETRMKSLVKLVLTRKLTVSDLEAADLDNDKVVSAAEFVIYKLKEMGKICDEDVAMVMEWFEVLDVDCSGTLTKDDLIKSERRA